MTNHRKFNLKIICMIIAVVCLFGGGYFGLRWIETSQQPQETRGNAGFPSSESITVEGITYQPRKWLTTFLLMGIDRESTGSPEHTDFRSGGQADFLRLVVVDSEKQVVTQIQIDRDTISQIQILSVLGKKAGMRKKQICLAHSFGDGREQSCTLTVEAVSRLLLGINIDFYLAIDLESIGTLNDWAGGVTVTIEDDLSLVDPAMVLGKTIRLQGGQAQTYVRSRMGVGDGTNSSRMRRQQTFLEGLTGCIKEKLSEDHNSIGELYDLLGDHLVTNISRGRLINEAYSSYQMTMQTVTIDGTHKISMEGYTEFDADESSIKRIVLDTFYQCVD